MRPETRSLLGQFDTPHSAVTEVRRPKPQASARNIVIASGESHACQQWIAPLRSSTFQIREQLCHDFLNVWRSS
ncbi:hypothetical protein PCS_02912 [Desulfocurvibacter africanus PCS]|uniref:Uncharacterized protein n=1 Tax=Desulfocurvibacter africanus PCS TaxID=1262666 RepID=M5PQP2_DESAF|nr:hypothetical protein PCS_02912 [Desulfocurvibacter africanus PCS]